MSCSNCNNKDLESKQLPCLCDSFVHPEPLNIDAGLESLPRQIATFHEFRRAMLRNIILEEVEFINGTGGVKSTLPLANWRARDKNDLGIMLLEMWAYICDSISFYDQVIANESYIRTNLRRSNLRKLIDLLGYIPRPAVGSKVKLTTIADGRLQITLPKGTAFRSSAFDGNPPQVFELTNDKSIHPFTNQLKIKSPHPGEIITSNPDTLLVESRGEIQEDSLLLLINKADETQNKGLKIESVNKYTGIDNKQYTKVKFQTQTSLLQGAQLTNLQILKPFQTAKLWTLNQKSNSIQSNIITLNILSQNIYPGEYILLSYRNQNRWFKVNSVSEVMRSTVASNNITINGNSFSMPGISSSVTQLILDADVNSTNRKSSSDSNWTSSIYSEIIIHFGMQLNAIIVDEPKKYLSATDLLEFEKQIETPIEDYSPTEFLLQDKNTIGEKVGGSISYNENKLNLNQDTTFASTLSLPVTAFANVITASRGETVKNEILGSGDASMASQSFKLKKKPLSYYPASTSNNDQGVTNNLEIFVDGIKWKEVPSFFRMTENDQVYIVRQNDEEESTVIFGDGIRGQRLPSGRNNILANYRFGAESACPPAKAVSQISKPIKGLRSVKNIIAAYGGADAEDAENMRTYAPKSALILGRVVSMKDMEARAASYPGVRSVKAEWRWDNNKQRASALIYYIGNSNLINDLSEHIRDYADPTTPISIETANPDPLNISIDIKIDSRYVNEEVINEIRNKLTNTDKGILAPENIGIGTPLYRSLIFKKVLEVEGVLAVQNIFIGQHAFSNFAIKPESGHYYDIEQGSLLINGI